MFNLDDNALKYGTTPLENIFILDYLPAAKGDYVKVYLHALFLSRHPKADMSIREMAQDLSLTESEVDSALRYWERRRLMARISDNPPAYRLISPLQLYAAGGQNLEADGPFVAFSEDVYALFGDRRKVTPAEISRAYEWVQDLKLPQEVVLMLLAHSISTRGIQFSFKSAEADALRMHEAGALTAEDAEAFFVHSRKVHEGTRAVLRRLGKRRQPSQDEMDLYRKWTEEWKYAPDAVLEACSETTKGEPTFAYLDGILGGIRARAAKAGAKAESFEDMRRQLQSDKTNMAAVQQFALALGVKTPPSALMASYQRLCSEHASELVLLAAEQARNAQRGIDAVEQYLEIYRKNNLTTRPEAERYIQDVRETNKALYRVFEACGHKAAPTAPDRALFKKWRSMGFSEEMIILAASQATAAESKPPYIDKVLQAWHEAGVTDPAQVSARKTARRPVANAARPGKQVGAQQYTQRDYTESELDSRLTDDILKEAKGNG